MRSKKKHVAWLESNIFVPCDVPTMDEHEYSNSTNHPVWLISKQNGDYPETLEIPIDTQNDGLEKLTG